MEEEYICPDCKKPIYDNDALLCHFCGGSLQRASGGFMSRLRYAKNRALWYFIAFFALACFVLLVIR